MKGDQTYLIFHLACSFGVTKATMMRGSSNAFSNFKPSRESNYKVILAMRYHPVSQGLQAF